MEKIVFVSRKHGRKTRHGYVDSIAGHSFAVCPVKADRTVYFGMPGAHEDFIQVYAEAWNGDADTLTGVIASSFAQIEKLNTAVLVQEFSARTLGKVRAKEIQVHKEYIKALLDEHIVYKGVPWK